MDVINEGPFAKVVVVATAMDVVSMVVTMYSVMVSTGKLIVMILKAPSVSLLWIGAKSMHSESATQIIA